MIKKSLTLLIFLSLFLTIASVSAADGSFSELQNIINDNTNGTISLDKDYKYDSATDDVIKQNGIIIKNDLVIEGNGYTLNGDKSSRIFRADTGNITIKDTNFINGYSKNGGAALHSLDTSTTFNIINCTFNSNIGTTGAAISSQGKVTVIDCDFTDNDGLQGAAIYSKSEITIINSKFNNNKVFQERNQGLGGAIYAEANVYINNSNLTNNNASDYGGAIYSTKNVILYNTVFTQNIANIGGAIYTKEDTEITNAAFNSNTAQSSIIEESSGGAVYAENNAKIIGSQFNNNNAEYYGGAIYTENTATIENSVFINNYVTGNTNSRGGAIYAETIYVRNSNFTSNNAKCYGGAIDSSKVISTNNIYTENKATQNGGAISVENIDTINDRYYKNNGESGGAISTDEINSMNTQYIENTANIGGAIHSKGNIIINNNIFTSNNAKSGGAIYTEGETDIKNSNLTENVANIGGAIYTKDAIIKQNKFTKNRADIGGAIFINENKNPTIINYNIFKDNTANQASTIGVNNTKNNNMDNNWWGTNTPNLQKETNDRTSIVYVIMEATSKGNLITTSLNRLNTGSIITEQLPTSTVIYSSQTGTFSEYTQEFTGTTSTLYQPTIQGTQTAYVTLDNQRTTLTLDVSPEPSNDTNITQETTILELEDLTKTYRSNENLKGTLKTISGEPIMGQHISLTLIRLTNGQNKTYDTVTDYLGLYELPINLSPGLYYAEAKYDGLTYRNITYLPSTSRQALIVVTANRTIIPTILIAETYTQPIYSTEPFRGTLTDTSHNPLGGQHISVKITRDRTGQSKTYDIITDYLGTYSMPINLSVGTYSVQCTYTGIDGYQSSSAYTKITVKN